MIAEIDLLVSSLVLLLCLAAVLFAGATPRQALTPVAVAAVASLVLTQVVRAGDATGPVVLAVGVAVGLDQAVSMLRRDRRRLRKLAARPHARHLLARRGLTTTGQPVRLAGAAVVVSVATLHLSVSHLVSAVPAGSPTVVAIAAAACLPVLPAVVCRLRTTLVGRVPALRSGRSERVLTVPHDPRAGLFLSLAVLFGTALAVTAGQMP